MKDKKGSRNRGKKLFFFLSRMTDAEKEGFAEWLQSPLHEKSPQLREMLDIVLQEMASSEAPQLNPDMFAQLLSPDRPLTPAKAAYIWARLARLQKALFEFLAWSHAAGDTDLNGQFLLESLIQRGWEKHILSTYQANSRNLSKAGRHRQMHKVLNLETTLNGYLASQGRPVQDNHLEEVHGALDHLFLHEKLKYACAGLFEGNSHSNPKQSVLLATAIQVAENEPEALPVVTQAYLANFHMLRTELAGDPESEQHFREFLQLFEGLSAFSADEATDLFTYGQNYCILRFRRGGEGFVDELQKLYDLILESGLILQKGTMPLQFYKNAVELMCRFRRFAWCESFIESYREQIAHDPDGLVYHYNLGVIRFYQGRFQEVTQQMYNRLGAFDRMQLGTGARVYFCRALWETGERSWLESVLNAFEQHLRRHKSIEAKQKANYLGFVSYLRRMCLAVAGDPGKREKLLRKLQPEIDKKESTDRHVWIRKKIAGELEGRE